MSKNSTQMNLCFFFMIEMFYIRIAWKERD